MAQMAGAKWNPSMSFVRLPAPRSTPNGSPWQPNTAKLWSSPQEPEEIIMRLAKIISLGRDGHVSCPNGPGPVPTPTILSG